MNLVLKFRELVAAVSQAVVSEFEQLIAAINTIWAVEHAEDGTHLTVTTPTASIDETGLITTEGSVKTLNGLGNGFDATYLAPGDYLTFGGVAPGGGMGSGEGIQWPYSITDQTRSWFLAAFASVSTSVQDLIFGHQKATNKAILRLTRDIATATRWTLRPDDVTCIVDGVDLGEDLSGKRFDHGYFVNVHANTGYYERQRTAKMGEWTAVPYAAGDFTASGGMTWTVQAGDLLYFSYSIVGKTLTVSWRILTSSTGGVAGNSLQIKIPGGYSPVGTSVGVHYYSDAGVAGVGYCVCSGTNILLRKPATANWNNAAVNTTESQGTFTFEVA